MHLIRLLQPFRWSDVECLLSEASRSIPPRKQGLWSIQEIRIEGRPNGRLGHFILGFGRDSAGEVYVLTSDSVGPSGSTGKVYRLVTPGRAR